MMNKTALVIALVLASMVFSCSKEEGSKKARTEGNGFTLEAAKITFTWEIREDRMHVTLKAPTRGWLGIGFNTTAGMKNANLVVGYVKDGSARVLDQHGSSTIMHKPDGTVGGVDDLSHIEGTEKNGSTEIAFRLPLKADDRLDAEILPEKDQLLFLAYGKTDRLTHQHLACATLQVNLSTGSYRVLKTTR